MESSTPCDPLVLNSFTFSSCICNILLSFYIFFRKRSLTSLAFLWSKLFFAFSSFLSRPLWFDFMFFFVDFFLNVKWETFYGSNTQSCRGWRTKGIDKFLLFTCAFIESKNYEGRSGDSGKESWCRGGSEVWWGQDILPKRSEQKKETINIHKRTARESSQWNELCVIVRETRKRVAPANFSDALFMFIQSNFDTVLLSMLTLSFARRKTAIFFY